VPIRRHVLTHWNIILTDFKFYLFLCVKYENYPPHL